MAPSHSPNSEFCIPLLLPPRGESKRGRGREDGKGRRKCEVGEKVGEREKFGGGGRLRVEKKWEEEEKVGGEVGVDRK